MERGSEVLDRRPELRRQRATTEPPPFRYVRHHGVDMLHRHVRGGEKCQGRIIQRGERVAQADGAVIVEWDGDYWHDLLVCDQCGYEFCMRSRAPRPRKGET